MRKIATAAATALVLSLAPVSSAVAQTPAETADTPVAAAPMILAQDGEEDDGGGNAGLWGLLGLLGLLGLIPRKQKEPTHTGATDYRSRGGA
ncbi:hypothetical protein CUT44_18185 [Streptomyces carminius]|uniref:Gram-positive cocci surface proteins LPxTG domain-containing protein n=1 Tax=Streptomyces carminius TaxID=2665496 RepID=A0A2M8LWV2_9ACTN|nr:WGxxGxxG family protein [Streptomyces carminius]PJE96433.1 hypothetical protein CUT44_18185 [Streptomyces carminius]